MSQTKNTDPLTAINAMTVPIRIGDFIVNSKFRPDKGLEGFGLQHKVLSSETHKTPEESRINQKPARNEMESRTGGHS